MQLTMPWPVMRELSPNWRGHWSGKARAKKVLREAWYFEALAQGARKMTANRLTLHIEFVQPNRRSRDLDNLLASIKAGLDGLADVLGVDDSRWALHISKAPGVGGYVRINVEVA